MVPKSAGAYCMLFAGLVIVGLASREAHAVFGFFERSADAHILTVFFTFALICIASFVVFLLAGAARLPSFVVAIFFGIAARGFFGPIISHSVALGAIVGLGSTLILFGGGLETPWNNFKKIVWKVLSLSFLGLFITAFLFSLALAWLGGMFGLQIPVRVVILLGAVLASTDPAAIIPILKRLRFHNRGIKDIVVSESAVTDVTGTLLTIVFLSLIVEGLSFESIAQGYGMLFSGTTAMILLRQIAFGLVLGIVGYGMLAALTRFIRRRGEEFETDAAYFIFVPVIIFTAALALGGSGYLAAFIAGLLFVLNEHLLKTERFFNQMIESFFKPTIFLLLGALVEMRELIAYAGIGIAAALIFMFVIRPIAVFVALAPFSFTGRDRPALYELFFISFVRETGAIPAVLLVTIVGLGIPGLDGLLPIGMWVILATLIIEPPLTPWIAKHLGVARVLQDGERVVH